MKDWLEDLPTRAKNIFKYNLHPDYDLNNKNCRDFYYRHRDEMYRFKGFGRNTDKAIRKVIKKYWPEHWQELEIEYDLCKENLLKNHRVRRLKNAQKAIELLLNDTDSRYQKTTKAFLRRIELELETLEPKEIKNENLDLGVNSLWSNPKNPKARKSPKFLNEIRQRKCIICEKFHEPQMSPTQAHHVIHDRFSQSKTDDQTAIPLCEGHHIGFFDTSKVAIHREPLTWRMKYGVDYGYSEEQKELGVIE